MKKNPVNSVTFMTYLFGIFIVAIPIINLHEKEKTPEWFLPLIFLFCSLSVIHATFKHQQKRIEALEEKLSNLQRQDQQDKE